VFTERQILSRPKRPAFDHSMNFNPRNDWRDPTDQRVVANFNTLEAFTDLFLY
jgi:hypothetical protein